MTKKSPAPSGANSTQSREDRLKAALKANMAKRKAQARARATVETAAGDTEAGNAGKSED